MAPQKDGTPPSEWTERRDEATRRAIERVGDELRDEFDAALDRLRTDFSQRLEREHVTYKSFTLGIVAMLLALFGLASQYMAPVKETATNLVQAVSQRMDRQDARLAKQDEKLERQSTDINAIMRVTLDGKPRKQVQKEWESATGVPRIDASP